MSPTPRSGWTTSSGCSGTATRRSSSTPASTRTSASGADGPASARPSTACAGSASSLRSVETVVLTHLHYDHTGNVGEFPNAELVVQRASSSSGRGAEAQQPAARRCGRGEGDRTDRRVDASACWTATGQSLPASRQSVSAATRLASPCSSSRATGPGRARLRRGPLLRGVRARAAVRDLRRPGGDDRGLPNRSPSSRAAGRGAPRRPRSRGDEPLSLDRGCRLGVRIA